MSKETQATIVKWADETFGIATIEVCFYRMLSEHKELVEAMERGDYDSARGECADVYVTLVRLADYLGVPLHEEVDRKMAINRARKWRSNGDGTGQHIKDGEP